MNSHQFHERYFKEGQAVHRIVHLFYKRYGDILSRAQVDDASDLLHSVFLALSRIDLSAVRQERNYILRAAKLHCWSILDRAMRQRRVSTSLQTGQADPKPIRNERSDQAHPEHAVTGLELADLINQFKLELRPQEVQVLNALIDEVPRQEIAAALQLNVNSLDTLIRRLRMKLSHFLREAGYDSESMRKFASGQKK